MTTMELEAYKMELIRSIIETDSREVLDAVKKTIKRATKKGLSGPEELTPHTLQEINSWIDESEAEFEAGNGIPRDEVHRQMNAFISSL